MGETQSAHWFAPGKSSGNRPQPSARDHPGSRGTVQTLRPYKPPVTHRPRTFIDQLSTGNHSLLTNKEISMVGDTQRHDGMSERKMPVWWCCKSPGARGQTGQTRFASPLFPRKLMSYQAIINGARGLVISAQSRKSHVAGGCQARLELDLCGTRAPAVMEEIGNRVPRPRWSPPFHHSRSDNRRPDVEFCVRKAGSKIHPGCKTRGANVKVEFSACRLQMRRRGNVESPRKVGVNRRQIQRWFAPFEVHVYRFKR